MDKNTKSTEKRGLKAFLKSRKARYGAVATGIVLGTVAIVIVINIIVGLLVSYFAVSRLVHEQVVQIGTKKALGFDP